MKCYRDGDCGPYEMYSCADCPASKPEYAARDKKVLTNGDRIRSMTDEELAEKLAGILFGFQDLFLKHKRLPEKTHLEKMLLEVLQKPVEEETP